MKPLQNLLIPMVTLILLSVVASSARADHDDWLRDRRREQAKRLDDLRDRQKDRLDDHFDAREDHLKRWYEREKDRLKEWHDHRKHYYRGRARVEFTRRYHAERSDLRRTYRQKKEYLDDREDALEDRIEHRYDRRRNTLKHEPFGPGGFMDFGRHHTPYGPHRDSHLGLPHHYGGGMSGGLPGASRHGHRNHAGPHYRDSGCAGEGLRRHYDDSRRGFSVRLPRGPAFSIEF